MGAAYSPSIASVYYAHTKALQSDWTLYKPTNLPTSLGHHLVSLVLPTAQRQRHSQGGPGICLRQIGGGKT